MFKSIAIFAISTSLSQIDTSINYSADKLAEELEAACNSNHYDFDTTFEYRVERVVPLEGDKRPPDLAWEDLESFRYVVLGSKLYINRKAYKQTGANEQAASFLKYNSNNVWAEGAWSHNLEGDNIIEYSAKPSPTDLQYKGFLFNLIESRYPSSRPNLAELVRKGNMLESSVKNGVLTYKFEKNNGTSSRVHYTLQVQLEPSVALLEYTREISKSPTLEDFHKYIFRKQIYKVLEWQQVGDIKIPKKVEIAHFGSKNPQLRGEQIPQTARTIYTRKSFKKITENDVSPEFFTVQLPIGMEVHDKRINLNFTIGKSIIRLDGVVYELAEPVMEHPGDRLGEMIRNAISSTQGIPPMADSSSPSDGLSPEENVIGSTSESSFLGSPITLAALVGIGVAFLTVAFLRSRQTTEKVV